jgi:predicted ATP-grasp superfamily ATP-dependent carboligase
MSKLAIFVGSLSNKYIDAFVKEGYNIGFFKDVNDDNIEKFLPSYLHKLNFVVTINFKNNVTVADSLKHFYVDSKAILVCVREKHFYSSAIIANVLKLDQAKSLNVSKAQHLTNKYFQRKIMDKQYPEITPEYKMIKTFHGAYLFARKNGFPVVVKPVNLSKGELVNICNNIEELSRKVSFVLDHVAEVYKRDKVYRKPQVIVEEFITGKQYSVDSYIDSKGEIIHTPVCKQVISHDLGFDDFQTYYSQYPSELNESDEKMVFETVAKSIIALGITSGTTHTEVKINNKGVCKIIEVNVRPGGFRSEMLEESYGIDHFKNFLNSLSDKPVLVKHKLSKFSACPQFWADKEGDFLRIKDYTMIEKLPSLVKFKTVVKKGEEVGPVNKGYGRVAYAILAHKDKEILEKDIKAIRNLVSIEVS